MQYVVAEKVPISGESGRVFSRSDIDWESYKLRHFFLKYAYGGAPRAKSVHYDFLAGIVGVVHRSRTWKLFGPGISSSSGSRYGCGPSAQRLNLALEELNS